MSTTVDRDAALAAAIDFALHQLEDTPLAFRPEHRQQTGATPEDRDAPFLSEALLYPLLGKQDARTLTAHFERLVAALGVSRAEWRRMLDSAYRERARTGIEVRPSTDPGAWSARAIRDRVAGDLGDLAAELRGHARVVHHAQGARVAFVQLSLETRDRIVPHLQAAGWIVKTRPVEIAPGT